MGYTEINTVCDLCNMYGRLGYDFFGCDFEFFSRYIKPQIPPMCPRKFKPGPRFRQENSTLMVEAVRISGGISSHELAVRFNLTAREAGCRMRELRKRNGEIGYRRSWGRQAWLWNGASRGEVAESNRASGSNSEGFV